MKSVHAETALRLAGLERGDRFGDVHSGRADLSFAAAALGARVVPTNWGPDNSLDARDDSFDVTGSWFRATPAPEALREMVRVTKPGGRVLAMGYRAPYGVEAVEIVTCALRAVVPDARVAIGRPLLLSQRLMGAGLRCVTYACVEERLAFRRGEELWDWAFTNLLTEMDDVAERQKWIVQAVLEGMLGERGCGAFSVPISVAVGTS